MFVLCIRTLAIAVLKKLSIHIPFCNGMAEVRDAKEPIIFVPSSIILTFKALWVLLEKLSLSPTTENDSA